MRKQELVHIHALLVEVTESLVENGAVSPAIWIEYDALGIGPHAIHAPKHVHGEAVLVLATSLGTTVAQQREQRSSVSVP